MLRLFPFLVLLLIAIAAVFSFATISTLRLLQPKVAQAATFTVNSTADAVDANPGDGVCENGAGNCTLRAAIMEANALAGPDAITLPAGNYTITIAGSDEDAAATGDLDIIDDLTITGAGAATTIIDGGKLDRVFAVLFGSQAAISDVTVRNGSYAGQGGGIFMFSSTLTLTNSIISNNTAGSSGGGIWNAAEGGGGSLTLINSTVSSNNASDGGGIFSGSGTLTLINSSVSDNIVSFSGGGIFVSSVLMLTNSIISNNSAINGGGIFNAGGTLTIANSTVSGNAAGSNGGGGITNFGGNVNLANSTVSDNTTSKNGGGLVNISGSTLNVTNSTISGNSANAGGGIYNTVPFGGGVVSLTNSTVSGNSANAGGGIVNGDTVSLVNSIIAGNTAPTDPDCNGSPTSLGYNMIGNDSGCSFTPATGDLVGTAGNPINPLLGPLQDNGGPTKTHALLPGSPAFDTGDDTAAPPMDQRGIARPQCGASDIGAYELEPAGNCFPVAFNQAVNIQEDTPVAITLKGADGDAGDTLSFIVAALPSSGNLSDAGTNIIVVPHVLSGDMITYAPETGFLGTDRFAFKVNDGTADSNVATVRVTIPATLTVTKTGDTNDGDCDADCSLREAIAAANPQAIDVSTAGDTIIIPSGTYTLTLGSELIIDKNLTLTGAGSEDTIIQSATEPGVADFRVFKITAARDVDFSGATVRYGNLLCEDSACSGATGGGILNRGRLTLTNSIVKDSTAGFGGGISNWGEVALANTMVSDNDSILRGGGIYNFGTLTLTDSTISSNTSSSCCVGGGIHNLGTLTITNSIITNNTGGEGGGGISNSGTLTITSSAINGNTSTSCCQGGGGIFNAGPEGSGTLILTNSTVNNNTASGRDGGGIHNSRSSVVILTNSTISNNIAANLGGGIYNSNIVTLTNSTISHNTAGNVGGGIYNSNTLTPTNSTISHNTARVGGGIYNSGGTLALTNSTVSSNASTLGGAGIFNRDKGVLSLTNTTISGNTTDGSGGGIWNAVDGGGGTLTLTSSTISANTGDPGGIFNESGTLNLANSMLANSPSSGDCQISAQFEASIISLGNNLDSDGTCGLTEATDLPKTDPLLGPLQDNGGPTETHALLPGSPAIDHIQVADCTDGDGNPIITDQRGVARPQGTACDIGAFEFILPCTIPDSGDWTVGEDCTLEGAAQAPANVLVEENVALTIAENAALDIDFSKFHLLIRSGAKVVIKDGGKIF